MLVRGRRVDNLPEQMVIRVTADALQVDPLIVATVIAVPMLLLLVLWVSISSPRKRKK
jgi:sortase A